MRKIKINNRRWRCLIVAFVVTFVFCWSNTAMISVQATTSAKSSSSDDSLAKRMWNFDYMDVPEAWNLIDAVKPKALRKESDRILVATLDTGINYNHPDLKRNVDVNNCVTVAGRKAPYKRYKKPKYGHGTVTAGIIAATSNNKKGIAGIAAGNNNDLVSVMAINVFQNKKYTSQGNASTKDIIKGIKYACNHGARVINMCLGHSPGSKDVQGKKHDDKALKEAINDAVKKDVVVVCSAGNHNNDKAWYPSDFGSTISVINTQEYKNAWSRQCKAKKSSYGSKKNISAPGNGVYTTDQNGSCRKGFGTSLAAPSVAGVVALMLYVNPNLKVSQVKEILYSTAIDLYKEGYDIYTGYGNVNAYRAVAAAAGLDDRIEIKGLARPSLKAQSAGCHSIKLTWNCVSRANGYFIYRASKENGGYKRIAAAGKGKIKSYEDKNCANNKTYYYKIKAYGTTRDGKKTKGGYSKAIAIKALGSSAIAKLKCKNIDYKTVGLSWRKADDASGYVIYRKASDKDTYKQVKVIPHRNVSKWTNTDLSAGRKYYYKICSYRTVQGKRYYSERSASIAAVPQLMKPTVSIGKKKKSITLRWKKVPQARGYKIYRSKNSSDKWKLIKTEGVGNRKYVNKGLKEGVKYRYKIRAYKKIHGKYIYSNYSSVKVKRI